MGQLVDRELAAEGVDAGDYALLSLIGVRGPVRLTEVAASSGMPLTTASDAIRRLEAGGRVERLPNPDDGRSSLFQLSATRRHRWRRGWPALRRDRRQRSTQALDDPAAVRRRSRRSAPRSSRR